MRHQHWLNITTENSSVNAAAERAGIAQRTLARQLDKGKISAENVIAIAQAYNHHPVGALVDTGYLDEKWAEQIDPTRALHHVTEEQLAEEVLRRMERGLKTDALTTDINELAHRRDQKRAAPDPWADGNIPDFTSLDHLGYAADTSPDESQERLNRGEDPID